MTSSIVVIIGSNLVMPSTIHCQVGATVGEDMCEITGTSTMFKELRNSLNSVFLLLWDPLVRDSLSSRGVNPGIPAALAPAALASGLCPLTCVSP